MSQDYWQQHPAVRRLKGMVLAADAAPRKDILFGFWVSVFERTASDLRETEYSEALGHVAIFMINSTEENAWAIPGEGASAVAISRKLVTSVADALVRAFGDIGADDDLYPFGVLEADEGLDEELRLALVGAADAPGLLGDRITILHQLYCHAASMVIHHELGHIARGHFDLLAGAGSKSLIDEALQLTASEFAIERNRFLEFDADAWALDFMLLGYETDWSSLDPVAMDAIFAISFATIVIGQILDRSEPPLLLQSQKGHPPPVWRSLFMTDLLVEEMVDRTGAERGLVAERVFLAWSVAERVAEKLGRAEGRWRGIPWETLEGAWQLEAYSVMRRRYVEFARDVIAKLPDAS